MSETDWITALVHQGYTMEEGAEVEVYGNEVSPGPDSHHKNTLDVREAADYINILTGVMREVLDTKRRVQEALFWDEDAENAHDRALGKMAEFLDEDALELVQARRKEMQNA
jgi:hypothetical protein